MAGTAIFAGIESGGESEETNAARLLEPGSRFVNSARNDLLSVAKDAGLRDAIDNLFRERTVVGGGSSMAMFREEVQTGVERKHWEKLITRRKQLMRIYLSGRLNWTDRATTKAF